MQKKSAKIFANKSANIFAKLGAKKFTQNLQLFYTCKFCTLVCTSDHVKRPLEKQIKQPSEIHTVYTNIIMAEVNNLDSCNLKILCRYWT